MYACDCAHQNVRRLLGSFASWKEWNGDWFLLGWNVSAASTVLLPLLMLTISRLVHWDADNDNGSGDNNDNNGGGSWWHWGNNNNNNSYNGQQQEEGSNDNAIPWWWFRRGSADPADRGKGGLIFVYVYSLLLFAILTLYGNFVLGRGSVYGPLQGEFCLFVCLLGWESSWYCMYVYIE
jgi:hypothetical protein